MDTKIIVILIIGILFGASVGYVGSNQIFKPQIEELKGEIDDHEERYESLSQQLEDLQQEHYSLLEQHFNEISELNEEISDLNEVLSDIPELYSILIDALVLEMDELMEEIAELRLELARTVKINEILYNPLGADGGNEWVELYNSGGSTVDLSGWTISGSDGSVKATLPSIDFPKGCFLIVHFGPDELGMYEFSIPDSGEIGIGETKFEDEGYAYYFVGTLEEVFVNDEDSVALYTGEPGAETIIDYVAWGSKSINGLAPPPTIPVVENVAEGYASDAGIWTRGTYFDTSYANENFVLRGETIGRKSDSTDTDGPEDWSDNGGSDAWGPTEGWDNSGSLYTYDVGLFITQYDINTVLWEYGFSIEKVSVIDMEVKEYDERLSVKILYEFTLESYGTISTFTGLCTHKWDAINETSYVVTTDITMWSNLGERFSLDSERYETGVDTKSHKSQRTLSATYIGTDGLAYPYEYNGTRTIRHIASDTFQTDDTREVLGLDGIIRCASSKVVEVVTSDTTSSFTLDAVITTPLEDPELIHMETFMEMDGDRQFNITIPVYTRSRGGYWSTPYELNLSEPATVEFKRVSGTPRDSFGRYEYTSKTTLGSPELGYATITVNLYEDYTKVDGKPTIRGEASASLNGYHIITRKYYVYDWWRRALRTGLRIVSAAAWGVACYAGVVVGAPSCVGKFVAVGACGAGMAATDILISEMSTEK